MICENREARFEYFIEDSFEAGIKLDGGEVKALPVIEIITENEYFDYDAKYNGHSQEVCPAQISEELSSEIQRITEKIYAHLGCNGIVRMDYISAEDGLYFLEVNTIPGMTSASLVPKMVRAAGYAHTEIVRDLSDKNRYIVYHK